MPKVLDETKTEESVISKHDVKNKFFIKDIENITGIKAHTIRIWEQRYNILKPKRTDTAVRYYEEDDLRFMLNVAILNKNGYKISKLAQLSRLEIAKKCLSVSETSPEFESQINALTAAMLEFNEREFNKVMSINMLKLGIDDCMVKIIFPFLAHVGILWSAGSIHPAHEHFVINLVRQKLYVGVESLSAVQPTRTKKFLLFVPTGETHDLGLLFANHVLRSQGMEVIFLGSGLPIEDLHNIFKAQEPDYIFTSLTSMNSQLPTQIFITAISKSWPKKTIFISGPQITKRNDLKFPENVIKVESPADFINIVRDIKVALD